MLLSPAMAPFRPLYQARERPTHGRRHPRHTDEGRIHDFSRAVRGKVADNGPPPAMTVGTAGATHSRVIGYGGLPQSPRP